MFPVLRYGSAAAAASRSDATVWTNIARKL